MIAIMPKLGAGEANATFSSSHIVPANKAVDQSFVSVLLEQTKSAPAEPREAQQRSSQLLLREKHTSVSGLSKRDTKSSGETPDRKTSEAGDRGILVDKISPGISEDQGKDHPLTLNSWLAQALPGKKEITDFAPDSLVTGLPGNGRPLGRNLQNDGDLTEKVARMTSSGADSTGKPATAELTFHSLSQDPILSKPQEKSNHQGTLAEVNARIPISASRITIDSGARLGLRPPIRETDETSDGSDPTIDGDHKAQAEGMSEIERVSVPFNIALSAVVAPPSGPGKMYPGKPPGVIPPALVTPTIGPKKIDSGKAPVDVPPAPVAATPRPETDAGQSLGSEFKQAIGKSRTIVAQDAPGTTRKNLEITTAAKSQPHKEEAPSPTSSQASDSPMVISAKAIEPTSSFFAAWNQPTMTPANDATTIGLASSGAVDRQHGQLEQKSAGAAESQAPVEMVSAYPTSLVHSAKLVERIGAAELRLGIRAGEFGSVDIRTSMIRNQFTAEIAVERGELGRVMTAELHGLQSRLTQQGIPEVSVTVHTQTGGQSTESEQQKPRNGREMYPTNRVNGRDDGPMTASVVSDAIPASSRLDVHM